ncbi:TonB-dependent receptor [Hymenobacter properus]|uniref:TonB-dependent receptor n=1 Tax=Hymenobacter properus TaxID=2791026 RepID=A0A931BIW1_9BACT|nr:TonB-dependent receptor [Hymenobacter properus]MBF9140305.1 TonB-dependent receptor [Hymenobacter properus]MBR7719112.1 TonB-dependent receptor [Microvirga sp. SRT04]
MKRLLTINRLPQARRGAGWALAAALVAGAAPAALAQPTKPRTSGKIEEAEIEIVTDRANQLPVATRNFSKIALPEPPKVERKVSYTFPDFRLPANRLNPSVKVLTIRAEEPTPLTGNLVKVGIGNYGTFYGRGYFHSTRNTDHAYGLDIKHVNSLNGPVDGKNSGVAETSAQLMGELYRGTAAFGANLDLGRERYNFYGYEKAANGAAFVTPENSDIKQVFNRFGVKAYAHNRDPEQQLQYDASLGYRFWNDVFAANENDVRLNAKVGYALGESSRITLNADASFISEKDLPVATRLQPAPTEQVSRTRTFVQATPAYEFLRNNIAFSVGATVGYSSDTATSVSKGVIYPAVRLGYTIEPEKFMVYAGLGGALQRVTRYDLSTENPWLNRGLNVADTHRGPTIYAGFTSTPARGLEFNVKATYARDRNLYFYANNAIDPSRFDLVYDQNATGVLNIHGELLYNAAEKFRLGTRMDYNKYALKNLPQPFHRPEFQGSVFGTYNVFEKLMVGVEGYFYSASYGISYRQATTASPFRTADFYRATDPIIDLNLRADYRITPKISIFVMGNNLANRQYQRFYGYPVKGINVIGGASYSF